MTGRPRGDDEQGQSVFVERPIQHHPVDLLDLDGRTCPGATPGEQMSIGEDEPLVVDPKEDGPVFVTGAVFVGGAHVAPSTDRKGKKPPSRTSVPGGEGFTIRGAD